VSQRGQLEALLNLLGHHPWPWDAALSLLIDSAVIAEEAAR
jgi:hypothetical protein